MSAVVPAWPGPGSLRVFEAHARTYRSTWLASAITAFVTPVLTLLAMGVGLGELVDDGNGADLGGTAYAAFVAPGILAATAMQVAAGEGSWPVMAGMLWRRTYHAVLATPVGVADLVAGQLLWVAVRLTLVGVVFGVTSAVVVDELTVLRSVAATGPAVLTGLAFYAPIAAFTATRTSDVQLSVMFRLVIFPLFLFSGTFFPVDELPSALRVVAFATPSWHGVELCRAVALDGTGARWAAPVHLGYLVAWVLTGGVVAVRCFHRELRT